MYQCQTVKTKGPIDNYSRMLRNVAMPQHRITSVGSMWMHQIQTALYNAYQSDILIKTRDFLYSNKCQSYSDYQNYRRKIKQQENLTFRGFISRLEILIGEYILDNPDDSSDTDEYDNSCKRKHNMRKAFFTDPALKKKRLCHPETHKAVKAAQRKHCVWCCSVRYVTRTEKDHYRHGAKTKTMCSVCGVFLCGNCFGEFHKAKHLNNPCKNHEVIDEHNKENSGSSYNCNDNSETDDDYDKKMPAQPVQRKRTTTALTDRNVKHYRV